MSRESEQKKAWRRPVHSPIRSESPIAAARDILMFSNGNLISCRCYDEAGNGGKEDKRECTAEVYNTKGR